MRKIDIQLRAQELAFKALKARATAMGVKLSTLMRKDIKDAARLLVKERPVFTDVAKEFLEKEEQWVGEWLKQAKSTQAKD